ncbi:MAG: DUF3177 family protein [Oscillatoriales cyanobacterium SM2_2_1]|nr:DUF3177 family protein [Oscillatoriales cyanobacterium SM2_2_1]
MDADWVRRVVWLDFRLAVVLTILLPMGLLLWGARARSQPVVQGLTIYWRVASLLAITVLLMIGGLPLSFLTGLLARVLIPISLWFWRDINEDLALERSRLRPIYESWRWAITAYCIVGTGVNIVFSNCGVVPAEQLGTICPIWFEPPLLFKDLLLSGFAAENILFWGVVLVIVYALYFGVFLMFGLPKYGRIASRD